MANPYHDGTGRFCSKGEMRSAIEQAAKTGDTKTYLALRADYEEHSGEVYTTTPMDKPLLINQATEKEEYPDNRPITGGELDDRYHKDTKSLVAVLVSNRLPVTPHDAHTIDTAIKNAYERGMNRPFNAPDDYFDAFEDTLATIQKTTIKDKIQGPVFRKMEDLIQHNYQRGLIVRNAKRLQAKHNKKVQKGGTSGVQITASELYATTDNSHLRSIVDDMQTDRITVTKKDVELVNSRLKDVEGKGYGDGVESERNGTAIGYYPDDDVNAVLENTSFGQAIDHTTELRLGTLFSEAYEKAAGEGAWDV